MSDTGGDPGRTAAAVAQRSLRPEEYQRLLCAYYEAMEPFIKQAIAFRAYSPSKFYVLPDGSFQGVFSPEQEIFEQRLHELAKLTAVRIFGGIGGGI